MRFRATVPHSAVIRAIRGSLAVGSDERRLDDLRRHRLAAHFHVDLVADLGPLDVAERDALLERRAQRPGRDLANGLARLVDGVAVTRDALLLQQADEAPMVRRVLL